MIPTSPSFWATASTRAGALSSVRWTASEAYPIWSESLGRYSTTTRSRALGNHRRGLVQGLVQPRGGDLHGVVDLRCKLGQAVLEARA